MKIHHFLLVFLSIFSLSSLSWAGGSAGGSTGGPNYQPANSDDESSSNHRKAGYGPVYSGCVDGTTVALPVLTGRSGGGQEQYSYVQSVCENNEWIVRQ